MKRIISLGVLLFTLTTGCMAVDPYGPRTSNSLSHGMTQAQVEASWGRPWSRANYRAGDTLYESWTYRRRMKTFMPSGARTHYDFYTVSFENGRMVGMAR